MFEASLLGLPAALFAHGVVFGRAHAAGESMHGILVWLACAIASLAGVMLALRAARTMRGDAPTFGFILVAAAAWFAAIEAHEHVHGVPLPITAVALAAASWLVRAISQMFAQTVAAVACAAFSSFSKLPLVPRCARLQTIVLVLQPAYRFRVFSRPPPAFS